MVAPDRNGVLRNAALASWEGESLVGQAVPLHYLVRKSKPNVARLIIHHSPEHARLLAEGCRFVAPRSTGEMVGFATERGDPRIVVAVGRNEYCRVQILVRIAHGGQSVAGSPPKTELSCAGRPDRSVMSASNANRLPRTRKHR